VAPPRPLHPRDVRAPGSWPEAARRRLSVDGVSTVEPPLDVLSKLLEEGLSGAVACLVVHELLGSFVSETFTVAELSGTARNRGKSVEPPAGIEPATY